MEPTHHRIAKPLAVLVVGFVGGLHALCVGSCFLLLAAVLPGLSEELSFRGLLQPRLIEHFGPAVGIAGTSLLFGLIHLELRQGLAATGVGLWFGWCAWREDSSVNVAFAHIINNGAFVLAKHFTTEKTASHPLPVVQVIVLLVCITAMFWRTRKAMT